ncbi:HugZ family protein [Roseovarius sp. MMSF_3281]|uniref:HugZ family pyridoxamine 5'-phosphate oxidase n=1 Tax=Roseovarius sp. MMSF_3281 TaxID=3046694 RepID=UPI00273EBB5B|nr:pyridoxamine 5'-phosphate oxidase family protein [Roseovarius sp. MMSF_3281]
MAKIDLFRDEPLLQAEVEPFGPRDLARRLLRTCRKMALATLDRHRGFPYSTLTNLSVEPDGTPVFYASRLSHHALNLLADARISATLVPQEGPDVLRDRRLTLVGEVRLLKGERFNRAAARYRRKFFRAQRYLELQDTCLFELHVSDIFLNGGPARYADGLRAEDLKVSLAGADELVRQEETLIAHLQEFPDKIASLLAKATGTRGAWRVATIDPEGMDLAAETGFERILFPRRVTTPGELLLLG